MLIVLEPRLPADGVSSVLYELEKIGLENNDLELRCSTSPLSAKLKVVYNRMVFNQILTIPGILWVEPVLPTSSRNLDSASIF